jgi:hypothetical protein
VEQVLLLDSRCSMAPALRRIRRETHFVKPDGESLARSINNLDGQEVKLVRGRWWPPSVNRASLLLGLCSAGQPMFFTTCSCSSPPTPLWLLCLIAWLNQCQSLLLPLPTHPSAACLPALQYVFEVSRGCGSPFLDLLRLRRSVVRLGFSSSQEALGWYVYVAACASIMNDSDPDFNKVRLQHIAGCTAAGLAGPTVTSG